MRVPKIFILIGVVLITLVTLPWVVEANSLSPKEVLGKSIFFDETLSINGNQSCASCHDPEWGWTGPDSVINAHGAVYEGSIPGRFGDRKPPTAAYATTSPIFHFYKGLFIGGNFWDGRATGEKLGNPAADQAQGPFLNRVEQGLPDSACVVYRVCTADYPVDFTEIWGTESCDITWPADVDTTCVTEGTTVALSDADRAKSDAAYDQIALSIAAYEDSSEVNAYSSKWDAARVYEVKVTKEQRKGFALFVGKGQCKACHLTQGEYPLLTDYSFDNLGIPVNPENPAYMADETFRDPGLGGFLESIGYDEDIYMAEWGKHKVPTLRNVFMRPAEGDVKAYGHNGYFKSLAGIVHFYNTRDVKPDCSTHVDGTPYTEAEALANDCWPESEIMENINTDELGDLGLSPEEEAAIVAFLEILDDGYPYPIDRAESIFDEVYLTDIQIFLPIITR